MKFRKLFATLAVVGTALVSLVACGGGKKGEISIWGDANIKENIPKEIKEKVNITMIIIKYLKLISPLLLHYSKWD